MAARDDLRAVIAALLAEAEAEIRSYPPPIPACDAQFNYLLALRDGLPAELRRLEYLARDESLKAADFLDSSPFRAEIVRRLSK